MRQVLEVLMITTNSNFKHDLINVTRDGSAISTETLTRSNVSKQDDVNVQERAGWNGWGRGRGKVGVQSCKREEKPVVACGKRDN